MGYEAGNFVSGLLDITIVKPFIESIVGTDLITGEKLTDFERGMQLVNAIVGAVTFGQGALALDLTEMAGKEIAVELKNGYDQISFKWTENGQNYEVRWHTKTPGAPEGQGNTWIPRYQWQDAINAYRNGTATQEQL